MGIIFGSLFYFAEDANATCVNYIESQTIAAAYEGDAVPTVHTMDTCGGDDTSYQIPIATTITFDGVEYSNIYATTNSVITFGRPDGTYWDYPQTPSISLYSMDWVSGWYNAPDTLNISYSEGGFQLSLQVIPFGQWSTPEASNINILVAITNTGGISVAYSYQGPEYPNLRTGVRLHDGSIVSLEAWGATRVQPGSSTPTLQADPISSTPTPAPITQTDVAAATQLSNDIANINNLIIQAADATNSEVVTPTTEPTPEPTTTTDPNTTVVEPEIITPEDPRFPDNTEEQNQPSDPNPTPSPETTPEPTPAPEPSVEPSSQPGDINQDQTSQPSQDQTQIQDIASYIDNSTMGISEDEAKRLVALAAQNKDLAIAIKEFSDRAKENTNNVLPYTLADATTEVQAEAVINNAGALATEILSDPAAAVGALLGNTAELLSNFSELGSDMTDDQRQKAQEVIVPVIIASQIISRRIK